MDSKRQAKNNSWVRLVCWPKSEYLSREQDRKSRQEYGGGGGEVVTRVHVSHGSHAKYKVLRMAHADLHTMVRLEMIT